VSNGGANAIILHKGLVKRGHRKHGRDIGLFIHLSGSTSLNPDPNDKVQVCTVEEAIALGADAVNIGTAALIALGCHVCQQCHTGKCAWGICSSDPALTKRINPEIGAQRLVNLVRGWSLEIKDMLGGMGVNAIESLRGNRLHLRAVGLTDTEMETLGVRMAGT